MDILLHKLKETLFSVLPVALVVLLINFFVVSISTDLMIKFGIGAFLIIFGLSIFLLGVDLAVSPIGSMMGSELVKKTKLPYILLGGFILGFLISVAEPDLHIIANQIELISEGVIERFKLILVVSLGIGISFSYGLFRIVKKISLKYTLLTLYLIIFILGVLGPTELLPITFDTSGATTGAITVPFVLAIAFGISRLNKNSLDLEKDSFGLVGIVSAGAIISIIILNIFSNPIIDGSTLPEQNSTFLYSLIHASFEVLLALSPIVLLFVFFNFKSFKLKKEKLRIILLGLLYTGLGMILFLTGVNGGFLEVGSYIGSRIADSSLLILIMICFFLGITTVLAEPAVYVLTSQIEEVTSGSIKRKMVVPALSIGVGIAITLAMLKIILSVPFWVIILPCYIIALTLSLFSDDLFIGISFDGGGVASGPMTATFILAFMNGIAGATAGANVLMDGFGMISLVAVAPIITLQVLGLLYKYKTKAKVNL